MRWLAILVLASVTGLTGLASASAGGTSQTYLRISYWEDGRGTARKTWTLRCNPAGGTLARPVVACRKLAVGGAMLFAPVPRDTYCTQVYGGPQVARIVGTVKGTRVWAAFGRNNGCEIARWDRLSPWLLPAANAS